MDAGADDFIGKTDPPEQYLGIHLGSLHRVRAYEPSLGSIRKEKGKITWHSPAMSPAMTIPVFPVKRDSTQYTGVKRE